MEDPSDRYLASILTHARDAILSTDGDGVVRTANRGAERLFDRPAEAMIGRPIGEAAGGEWAEALPEMVLAVGALACVERDVRLSRDDGTYVDVGLVLATVSDEHGRTIGVSAIARDITEYRRALRDLARTNADLEQFAFAAAHDLREPVRSIRMLSSILEEWCSEGEAAEYLARVQHTAGHMQALVDGLYDYARLSGPPPVIEPVALDDVMADVMAALADRVAEAGATVDVGPLPVVRGARDELRLLLTHLVQNALEYRRPDGAPLIGVRGHRDDEGEVVRVHDDGIGFDARYARQLFNPFQRLHTKGEHPGAGLGLAVCRRIMERHGGHISARSAPDRGSTFSAWFPPLD